MAVSPQCANINPGGTHHCRRIESFRLSMAGGRDTRRSPSSRSRLCTTLTAPHRRSSLSISIPVRRASRLTLDMMGNERLEVLMMAGGRAERRRHRRRCSTSQTSMAAADITLPAPVRPRPSRPARLPLSHRPAACYVLPSFGCCFGHYNLEKLIKSCFLLALPTTTTKRAAD